MSVRSVMHHADTIAYLPHSHGTVVEFCCSFADATSYLTLYFEPGDTAPLVQALLELVTQVNNDPAKSYTVQFTRPAQEPAREPAPA